MDSKEILSKPVSRGDITVESRPVSKASVSIVSPKVSSFLPQIGDEPDEKTPAGSLSEEIVIQSSKSDTHKSIVKFEETKPEREKDLFEIEVEKKKSVKIAEDEPEPEPITELSESAEIVEEEVEDEVHESTSGTELDQNVEEMLKQFEEGEDTVIQGDVRTSVAFAEPSELQKESEATLEDEAVEDEELPEGDQDKLTETSMDAYVEDKRDYKHEFDYHPMEGEMISEVPEEEKPEEVEEEESRAPRDPRLAFDMDDYDDDDDETQGSDAVAKEMKELLRRRKSRRLSLMEAGPRIPYFWEQKTIAGDFKTIDNELIFGPDDDLDLDEVPVQEEEEKASIVEKTEEVKLDRTPYFERHPVLLLNIRQESLKNYNLQRKLIDLLRKKKMDTGLRETEMEENVEFIKRYKMQLIAFEAQEEFQNRELQLLNDELDHIKKLRDTAVENKETLFKNLQDREKEVGTGLIFSKTGKTLPDKSLETLIHRQKNHQDQICSMRLKFIKLKNKVADVQVKLQELELIDGHLSLMDYESLKLKFRGYVEKLEEREDELNKLRVLCQNSIQILAHYKEKSYATDADLDSLLKELDNVENEVNTCRENLNSLKQERDNYRNMTYNLREESGLLTKPDLLFDMESSIEELKAVTEKLHKIEHENARKKIQVRNIRKNIEIQSELKREHVIMDNSRAKSRMSRMLKQRSKDSIVLPSDAFEDLNRLPKPNPCLKKLKIKY